MGKYVIVEKETCISCGSCASAAPDIFDFDYDMMAEVVYEGDNNRGVTLIGDDLLEDLQDAVESCPSNCIQLAAIPFA